MSAFDDVYRQHFDAVFRFAWRLVGRREIAEEVAAETFLELYRHMETIDLGQLPSWLFTVARHRAVDYWRRRMLEDRYLGGLPANPTAAPMDESSGLLEHPSLKPVHRLCLRLRYGHGMTVSEIASATGLSPTQAKGHLQYARRLLRKGLTQEVK